MATVASEVFGYRVVTVLQAYVRGSPRVQDQVCHLAGSLLPPARRPKEAQFIRDGNWSGNCRSSAVEEGSEKDTGGKRGKCGV